MGALTRELNLQNRPNWLLRKFMGALESKRMEKKLGWSRPWNKYGLTIFRSHTFDAAKDEKFLTQVERVLVECLPELPPEYSEFISSVFRDPQRMAFTFYHNNRIADREYEGLTLSLGRKVPEDKTKRDRLDVILEDLRVNGSVDGRIDRVRFILNPWNRFQKDEMFLKEWKEAPPEPCQNLYAEAIRHYHEWKEMPSRQWEHWSIRYIDYFGSRGFIPKGSSFT
jgi:hypothetical protein